MKAHRAILRGPRQLEFEEIEVNTGALAATAVFAKTQCSAISTGTEMAAYSGQPPLRPGPVYPRLVGYCNVAAVESTGTAVTQLRPGDRILTHQSHQSAFVCEAAEILGVVPEEISAEAASLSYLAQLGLTALQRAHFQKGETVAVLGLGVIGLATTALIAALGGQAVALGNNAARLALAHELGAQACFDSSDPQLASKIGEVKLLVTTVNSWAAWKQALEISSLNGRIAVLGFPGRSEGAPPFNPLDSASFYDKQLSIFAAGLVEDDSNEKVPRCLKNNLREIFQLMKGGRLPLERLITHRIRWDRLREIYDAAAAHDKSLIGAVLNWTD